MVQGVERGVSQGGRFGGEHHICLRDESYDHRHMGNALEKRKATADMEGVVSAWQQPHMDVGIHTVLESPPLAQRNFRGPLAASSDIGWIDQV